jgi:ParB-like chromosome segregation protein Spo0J
MKIEKLQISKLIMDPRNARTHDEANLVAIEGSLREFGQRKPIVISEDNVVVAGNGTIEAAKRLGWNEIETVRVPSDWTEDKIKAFAIADNRTAELAAWDTKQLEAQLSELEEANFDISYLAFTAKRVELPDNLFDSEEVRLDQRTPITCPNCATEFRKTATGFEIV